MLVADPRHNVTAGAFVSGGSSNQGLSVDAVAGAHAAAAAADHQRKRQNFRLFL